MRKTERQRALFVEMTEFNGLHYIFRIGADDGFKLVRDVDELCRSMKMVTDNDELINKYSTDMHSYYDQFHVMKKTYRVPQTNETCLDSDFETQQKYIKYMQNQLNVLTDWAKERAQEILKELRLLEGME